MKKLFTENKALVYVVLSFLSMIIFLTILVPLAYSSWSKFIWFLSEYIGICRDAFVNHMGYRSCIIGFFANFLFAIKMTPKEALYFPMLLLFAGTAFGILAIMRCRETMKPMSKMIFAVIGILLNSTILVFLLSAQPYSDSTMTAVVSERAWKRVAKFDEGAIVGSFCVIPQKPDKDLNLPAYLVDIFEDARIYEQYGTWFWQKQRVKMDALQPGQVVDIEYHWIYDSVVSDLDPTNDFSVFPLGATQITIRKGEYMPYEAGCGFYPKP